jgi:hypothetical protein
MASNKKTNRYNSGIGTQSTIAKNIDELAEYEEFKASILPKLRRMIRDGKSAEDIYAFSQSVLAARAVTIGMSSEDEKTALTAIREVLDRGVGKAADKLEITSRYKNLSDEELSSLLSSQEKDLEEDEAQKH